MNSRKIHSAHGPKSWNQTAQKNAKADLLIGIESVGYTYFDLLNPIRFLRILWKTDVFHFYAGYTLLPISTNHFRLYALLGGFDIRILKLFRKKIVLHYQGCELRDRFNEEAQVVCTNCKRKEVYCRNDRATGRRKRIISNSRRADALVVTTPDLKQYLEPLNSTWIPKIGLNLSEHNSRNISQSGKLKIIHAPSNRSIKGSDKVIEVISKHSDKFELILLENVSREEVYRNALQADLAVDQLRIGWYGNFAVEMMSIGLPVICFIKRSFIPDSLNEFPIINASPVNLEDVLLEIYENRNFANTKKALNTIYLKRHHSEEAITGKLKSVYDKIFRNTQGRNSKK
ncbi:MAG: hypothetical protein R2850_01765 [Bacteroidia bacterium]